MLVMTSNDYVITVHIAGTSNAFENVVAVTIINIKVSISIG